MCLLVLWNINLFVVNGIVIYQNGTNYQTSNLFIYYIVPMYLILLPIKDFLIAIGFVCLYYHQGAKKIDKKRKFSLDDDDENLMGSSQLNNCLLVNIFL